MTIRTVGPSSDYATIAAAMNAAGPGDTIFLQAGYSNETAAVDFSGMTIYGDASSHGIVLHLGAAVATVSGKRCTSSLSMAGVRDSRS